MSDPVIAEPTTESQESTEGATPEPTEELGKPGLAALQAERDARKAAEARIKEFEDREKTETQKQQEALESAKAELAKLTTAKTRAEVAAAKSVPTSLLAGPASTSEEDVMRFADALIAYQGDQGGTKLHVPSEGTSPALALNGDGIEGALRNALGIA